MTDNRSFSLQALRELDRERFLACLYLPANIREDIATLWAFDAEISRIPSLVSEPMPGEIRLQWWRDLVKSGGNAGSGPLADQLISVIERHDLPRETFHTYLDARIFDLYQDPMPDTGSFEGYLGETVSAFFQNSALCLGAERSTLLADACGHAGMAVGISRLMAQVARSRARKQLFFPLDLLEKHALDRESWLGEEVFEEHLLVLEELDRIAQYHLTFSRSLIGQLPKSTRPVFLELSLVEPAIRKVQKLKADIFRQPAILSPVTVHWALFRAAARQVP